MGFGGGMGGIANLLQQHPEFLAQLQGGNFNPSNPAAPGGQGGMGTLSQLPIGHQMAAQQPAPIPGGGDFSQLGKYSQQALGLAGVNPAAQQPGPQVNFAPPPRVAGGAGPGGLNFGGPHGISDGRLDQLGGLFDRQR